jgi:uncharacterized membrane protein
MHDWMGEPGIAAAGMSLAAGLVLAAVAGFRAFLPLLAIGLAARLEWLPLSPGFAWLASTPALIAFASACVFELLGDKFPAVDHLLDVVGTAIRPLAGALSVAALLGRLDPVWAAVVGLAVGGTVAGGVHLVKAKTRLGSSLVTAGLANPALSVAEDLVAIGGTLLALLWPLLAVALLSLFALSLWLAWRFVRRRARPSRPAAPPLPAR